MQGITSPRWATLRSCLCFPEPATDHDHRAAARSPILRIFDIDKAKEFYVEWLGCTINFEHRFDDDSPLFMQVSRDGMKLHLSEGELILRELQKAGVRVVEAGGGTDMTAGESLNPTAT